MMYNMDDQVYKIKWMSILYCDMYVVAISIHLK